MKILIADDDKEIVELLSIYVHNEGYEAVKAYDGKEALSKIRTILLLHSLHCEHRYLIIQRFLYHRQQSKFS